LVEQIRLRIPPEHIEKYIFCDNAEPATIQDISDAGYNAWPADKTVRDGINCVKKRKIFLTPESVNIIKEIKGYSFKKNKDGTVLEEPIKYNDHAMDAIRYAVFTYFTQFYCENGEVYIH
jgi:phage terminase large subunit